MMEQQFFSASAKGGGALFFSAALMLLCGILLLAIRPELLPSQGWVLWFLLNLLALFVALVKLNAPVVLVEIDAGGLRYHHPRGSWLVPWSELVLVQQLELEGRALAWIGVRVRDYDQILPQIPLRLAVRLLIEQRGVLIAAVGAGCAGGRCAADYLLDATEFRTATRVYKGVQGMFGQRMAHLRQLLQADLLIPADIANCSPADFCRILNRQRLNFTQKNNG